MERQTDIAIIGGGIAGLALAVLLGQDGIKVDLVDPAKPPAIKDLKPSGRTAALFGSSVDIIQATGIWNKIKDQAGALKIMRIIDESRETITADFEAEDLGKKQFGFNVSNGLLRSALFEQAQKTKNVTLHVPNGFVDYAVQGQDVLIALKEGKKLRAKLIVGADGRNSGVRNKAGITADEKKYDQSALTFLINHSRSHDNVSTEFHRSGGPLALVPLPGNQSSVVWVEKTPRAEELIRLRKQEFEQNFQDAIGNALGGVTLATTPECWPLMALKAHKLTAPRMALIAEAAHVMSPVAAQGLNLSLRDVDTLVQLILRHAKLGFDIGAASLLQEYERKRRLDVGTRTFGVDMLSRLSGHENAALSSARRLGLKTIDAARPLKKFLMKQALNS